MKEMFVMEKPLMGSIIAGLKTLKLSNYEDYCRIVGIVSLLEQAMMAKPPEESEKVEVINNG